MWGSKAAGQREDGQEEQERPLGAKIVERNKEKRFKAKIRVMLCPVKSLWNRFPAALQKDGAIVLNCREAGRVKLIAYISGINK